MKRRLFISLAWFVIVMIILSEMKPAELSAQSALTWSPAQRIRGYANDSNPPYLVADQNKIVHAFNSQLTGGDLAIFYSQWSLGRGWTTPVDILLSPKLRQATVQGVFLDSKGIFHLIFFGGIEFDADIYYSRAPAANAGNANAWSPPKSIGAYAGKLISATLTGDNEGNLYVVYSGNREGNGAYVVRSTDGGDHWSDVTTIFLTDSGNSWAYTIRTTLDSQGSLHAVWTLKNRQGTGDAVYYARLDPGRKQSSLPITLHTTMGGDYQTDWPSIIYYKNELFVFYDNGLPPHRWMRRSTDGGRTWTDAVIPFASVVGEDGSPVFLVDGDKNLHVLFANRTSDNRLQGLWHSQWMGVAWGELDAVVTGQGSPQFNPSRPQGVVSQGNIILVTWRSDPGLTPNGIWYSYATLNGSELPILPLPTAVATIAPTLTLARVTSIQPSPTATLRPTVNLQTDTAPTPNTDTSPATGIALGILPVGFLLLVVILTRRVH